MQSGDAVERGNEKVPHRHRAGLPTDYDLPYPCELPVVKLKLRENAVPLYVPVILMV